MLAGRSGTSGGEVGLLWRAWWACWAVLPALGAAWLGVPPGPRAWLAACAALPAAGLAWGLLSPGPRRSALAFAAGAPAALVGGTAAVLAAGFAAASLGPDPPPLGEATAAAIYDLDARVATRPLPRCDARPAASRVLLERGAHPRLDADGARLWFDAPGEDGRRQVHRLELASGRAVCWTCGEPGNNRRPVPAAGGVLFDTDRWATRAAPWNTELQQITATGEAPRRPSRRLTYHPGRDDHALPGPGGGSVVWSRAVGGRFAVVSAGFQRAHGALLLDEPRVVAAGGAAWAAPLAWSPDARALLVGRGNPFGSWRAEALDPATGRTWELGADLAGADFSADGGRIVLAGTRPAGLLGRLPAGLGFALGPLALGPGERGAARSGSTARTGDTGGEVSELALGELGAWGAPTGIALEPDGTGFVLGQRRAAEGGVQERLVRVTLECSF